MRVGPGGAAVLGVNMPKIPAFAGDKAFTAVAVDRLGPPRACVGPAGLADRHRRSQRVMWMRTTGGPCGPFASAGDV